MGCVQLRLGKEVSRRSGLFEGDVDEGGARLHAIL